MFDTFTVITIIVTFLFAGTVKGVIGLGLAIISLGLLTMTIGLQEAMGLLIVPSFVTNFWQAIVGGFGFLTDRFPNPKLNIHEIDVENKTTKFNDKVKIPLKKKNNSYKMIKTNM